MRAHQREKVSVLNFLHIERTKVIFHFISAESANPKKDYEIIRKELGAYKKELLEKQEYLFLTKNDLWGEKEVKEKLSALKKINPQALAISIYDSESIKKVEKILNIIKAQK